MRKLYLSLFLLVITCGLVAQNSYALFCVNVTQNFDAEWVVDQIDAIRQVNPTESFTVYYTMGYLASDTEMYYNSLEISDVTKWERNKEKLRLIKPETIVRNQNILTPTRIDLEMLLAKHYEVIEVGGIDNISDIYVYWFGDSELYQSQDCGLPFIKEIYLKCDGDSTWKILQLMNNNGSPLRLDMSSFDRFKADNIKFGGQ